MTELNGLAHIITTATLHGITGPPEREDYQSDSAWRIAYHAWYRDTHYWHATVDRPAWHDDALPEEVR